MIDWAELFQMQRELDERIIRDHGLADKDLMPDRVVAFMVELSEFANEARFFKFWSNDQEPRRRGKYLGLREHVSQWSDPLLEEFVDALHFAIGIGLELGLRSLQEIDDYAEYHSSSESDLFMLITSSAHAVYGLYVNYDDDMEELIDYVRDAFTSMFEGLRAFGIKRGLTDDEIVTAYKAKHAENHHRQDVGY